jgi:hypothetical protein
MRIITCRNGLVRQGRRARLVFVAAMCIGLVVTSARGGIGGSLDSPASPTDPASAMWTLKDIYDVLDTRTTNVALRPAGFTEPTGGPTNGTMRTLNDIMALVTNRAPVPKTGQRNTYAVDDDGTNRIGVAWPVPRFTVLGDTNAATPPGDALTNCVRDNLTGLIWARDANIASNSAIWGLNEKLTWSNAFDVITCSSGLVNAVSYGGTNDWRLPNERELKSLTHSGYYSPALCNTAGTGKWTIEGDPFWRVQSGYYWSSTTYEASTTYAWPVNLSSGYVYPYTKVTACYVWPVRGGE